jgi:hypothetical protein
MLKRTTLTAIAGVVCGVLAIAGVSLATAAKTRQVTLGSTTGTPDQNICLSGIRCTYLPIQQPKLRVPFNGTVTRFRVNAGSFPAKVWLRVLRPAAGGKFTGIATSRKETLKHDGVNTFKVSLKVKAGDLIGLDNGSSALMFDTSNATAVTDYYELPRLHDGQTAAPNHAQTGIRLLLSATVVQ